MTRVLLYSGGMDSYIANTLWGPDVLLYAALGHRYQRQELRTMARSGLPVMVDNRLVLGDLELPNAIIPLRNLYLFAMATHYGHTVALGALAGEVNPDKSEAFRQQAQQVLSTCYAESYWSDGEPVVLEYPLASYSKAQAVALYLDAGGDPRALVAHTRSCYEPTALPCGHCSACLKRHIALALNGLVEETARDPHTSPYLEVVRQRWPTFDALRREETARVFPQAQPTATAAGN